MSRAILPLPKSYRATITCTVGEANNWNLNASHMKKANNASILT